MGMMMCGAIAGTVLNATNGDAAGSNWKFTVDAAIEGGHPSVKATAQHAESLVYTISKLTKATSRILETRILPASDKAEISFPEVPIDTYVDLTVTTAPQPAAPPLFQWRTLLRPTGKTLMSYTGRAEMLPPGDFDAYWARAKKELDAAPLTPVISRVPDKDTSTGLLRRVELPAAGGTRIVCWYFVPRAALDAQGMAVKKCPAVIVMPGYGAEEPPLDRTTSGMITLSVNPRNHGPSRDFWKAPQEHLTYKIEDPENYYYRYAFLDGLRGAQFLFSRDEADASRVGTEGGSQGGLFALAIAALEPRIACVCSNVTAFTDYPDALVLDLIGGVPGMGKIVRERSAKGAGARKSLSYTDGASMATRVRCPVQINMGGIDPVCHFVCGIVAYNRLPKGVVRQFNLDPAARHEVPATMRAANARWQEKWLFEKDK